MNEQDDTGYETNSSGLNTPTETGASLEHPAPGMAPNHKRSYKKLLLIVILLAAAIGGGTYWLLSRNSTPDQLAAKPKKSVSAATSTGKLPGLQLDTSKNYGNKYADGILPVGDNKYVTDAAKQGYVYMCRVNFVPSSHAGAQKRGPWFVNNNSEWDINKKTAIQGSVTWQPSMSVQISGGKRIVTTNDLPTHATGVFPVGVNDPARLYDANPNTISAQSLTYNLTASPTYGTPNCMSGEVGIMLTGVVLFNGFDAGGRDAGAWEIQDSCDGHPQNKGEYHYHTLSRCITDINVQTVIGFALDGFPITGPKVGKDNILTTSDLDECHGITSQITLHKKKVTSYHYVMTQDFPYSVSCFRAPAINAPGLPENSGRQQPPADMPPR